MQKEIDWSKYSNDSIDFIFSQSEITLNQTIVSYRENINKSYAALAVYIGILSYCIKGVVDKSINMPFIYLLIAGTSLSFWVIFYNLRPKKMAFSGSCKSFLCQEYYENEVAIGNQITAYKIQTIDTYDVLIKENISQISIQVDSFKMSLYIFIGTMAISLIALLFYR
jgi:hypothetical protein